MPEASYHNNTEIAAVCYADQGGKPCGRRAAASLVIVPPGQRPSDAITSGRIDLCMRHLLTLMYTNGVGSDELASVVDGLATILARRLAAEGPATSMPIRSLAQVAEDRP